MSLFEIIRRPIITEKALDQKEDQGILCFEVQIWANKQEVIKKIWDEASQGSIQHIKLLAELGCLDAE